MRLRVTWQHEAKLVFCSQKRVGTLLFQTNRQHRASQDRPRALQFSFRRFWMDSQSPCLRMTCGPVIISWERRRLLWWVLRKLKPVVFSLSQKVLSSFSVCSIAYLRHKKRV